MAGAEVTVSTGELMMVKEEEGESSGSNHKTQVFLHLHPILQGVKDGIADGGTTVLAIETHDDDNKTEGEEIEYGYPITCGDSRAVLLFKKFVCPGINVRCVKFNDQLISPKQFVHLAGKATLKDWKRAIRLGGVMLRKMMDSGQIDFYQHDTACSNTCRSTKFDVPINSARLPPGTSVQPSPSCLALDPLGGQVPLLTGRVVHEAPEVEETLEDKFSATAEWMSGPAQSLNSTANGHAAKRKRAYTPDGVLNLWKGVADSGLMSEVLSSLQTELFATLKGVELRSEKANLQETDAIILNSLCEMFGLLDSVKQALDLRCSQNQENKTRNCVYVLGEPVEEQRRRGRDKSKSSKHFRPQRHNSQTQNVLSPVRTSPTVHPLCLTGSSAAYHAQLSIDPQLFTRFSASTGQYHQTRAGRMNRGGRSATLKHSETGSQEKLHHLGQEGVEKGDTIGRNKEPGRRTDMSDQSPEAPQLRSEEVEETDGLCDIERVIIGRKASTKHK
ncbi:glucocorticoid modulatory element-binding protein 1-like isoform X2 [Anabas testudineus]|uniref:SAND domain-containing protein n=2 Tax=Anabas testudineus TaxID=64144 RepID=A0A3Q1JME5_ANATE|nr:glucocorticoid modulatory element-binding protein 1-like isoform X2 [Anabas testudineus]